MFILKDLGSEDEMIIYQIISLAVLHRGFWAASSRGILKSSMKIEVVQRKSDLPASPGSPARLEF